jgi:hypothetical protein
MCGTDGHQHDMSEKHAEHDHDEHEHAHPHVLSSHGHVELQAGTLSRWVITLFVVVDF